MSRFGEERLLAEHHADAFIPYWTVGDACAAADEVVAWLHQAVTPYPPGNRFEVYRTRLGSRLRGPRDFGARRTIEEALRGIMDLFLVMRASGASGVPADKLRVVLGGKAGRALKPPTAPWDVQFELLSFAILRFAGLADVRFVEPDLAVPSGPTQVGFAIKRVTSRSHPKLLRRLRDAIAQLDRNRIRGVAVLEGATPELSLAPPPDAVLDQLYASLCAEAHAKDHAGTLVGLLLLHFQPQWVRRPPDDLLAGLNIGAKLHILHAHEGEQEPIADWIRQRGQQLVRRVAQEHAMLRERTISPEASPHLPI